AELDTDELLISLARVHQAPEDDPDDADGMIAMLGKTLAQVLSIDWLASTQGLHVEAQSRRAPSPWVVRNAAASLYRVLPKPSACARPLPENGPLPRLALVAVTSRKADSLRNDGQPHFCRTCVYGETVLIEQSGPATVSVRRARTFSGTYNSDELYAR